MTTDNKFNELFSLNVSEKIEEKEGLKYLSWAWAWAEFKKTYPTAEYEVRLFEGKPYIFDEKTGYMVFTEVWVGEIKHEMWLPVMDGKNKAMKSEPYTYKTKYGEKTVEAATMFDINKTIMRCLTKNLAMFGLGLYIYAGEDLPEGEEEEKPKAKVSKKPVSEQVYNNEIDAIAHAEANALVCSDCGQIIDKNLKGFSMKNYGKPLCRNCLKNNKRIA